MPQSVLSCTLKAQCTGAAVLLVVGQGGEEVVGDWVMVMAQWQVCLSFVRVRETVSRVHSLARAVAREEAGGGTGVLAPRVRRMAMRMVVRNCIL